MEKLVLHTIIHRVQTHIGLKFEKLSCRLRYEQHDIETSPRWVHNSTTTRENMPITTFKGAYETLMLFLTLASPHLRDNRVAPWRSPSGRGWRWDCGWWLGSDWRRQSSSGLEERGGKAPEGEGRQNLGDQILINHQIQVESTWWSFWKINLIRSANTRT